MRLGFGKRSRGGCRILGELRQLSGGFCLLGSHLFKTRAHIGDLLARCLDLGRQLPALRFKGLAFRARVGQSLVRSLSVRLAIFQICDRGGELVLARRKLTCDGRQLFARRGKFVLDFGKSAIGSFACLNDCHHLVALAGQLGDRLLVLAGLTGSIYPNRDHRQPSGHSDNNES